jgi:arylsulfatase A-like enzyme
MRLSGCYTSDAPCLPSRAALMTGRLGIHTGVVGHGGTAGDMRLEGESRNFHHALDAAPWMWRMRKAGYRTATITSFPERHSAWWFYYGFNDMVNPGFEGHDHAHEVAPYALDWLNRHGAEDDWFLHVNFWDPHTPYHVPPEYGNPFESESASAWHTEEVRRKNWEGYGPHSAQESWDYSSEENEATRRLPNIPRQISSQEDYKAWIDGYDGSIRYMDDYIGKLLDQLERQGILDDTAIIVHADHGENQGELNIYGDHQTADQVTCNVPLIVRWPGVTEPGTATDALVYSLDLPATVTELVEGEPAERWDSRSFADVLRGDAAAAREELVISQCAWSCQRAVRWDDWLFIRTYHDGLKDLSPYLLFDISEDPHELDDLAESRPEIVAEGVRRLDDWVLDNMRDSDSPEDPLWRVMHEGGPHHTREHLELYCKELRRTGREHHAATLEARHGN